MSARIGTTAKARLSLVLGGARSGKSAYAEGLITAHPPPWIYIATSEVRAGDSEMRQRIALHQSRRGDQWRLIEEPLALAQTLARLPQDGPVLIDCLTLWLSNVMLAECALPKDAEGELDRHCDELVAALARPRGPWVVVSNEVGQGIVPDNALARRFRDEIGRLNQRVAALAHDVFYVTAGLPQRLK